MNSLIINTILDMKAHAKINGNQIYSDDQPKQLMKGWICLNTNKIWQLRLGQIRQDLIENNIGEVGQFLVGKKHKELLSFINNKIDSLPFGEEVERFFKLKAFW